MLRSDQHDSASTYSGDGSNTDSGRGPSEDGHPARGVPDILNNTGAAPDSRSAEKITMQYLQENRSVGKSVEKSSHALHVLVYRCAETCRELLEFQIGSLFGMGCVSLCNFVIQMYHKEELVSAFS